MSGIISREDALAAKERCGIPLEIPEEVLQELDTRIRGWSQISRQPDDHFRIVCIPKSLMSRGDGWNAVKKYSPYIRVDFGENNGWRQYHMKNYWCWWAFRFSFMPQQSL